METPPMSSQVAEGQEPMSGSPQAAGLPEQSGNQAQEASQSQVEGNGQGTSQDEAKRASDFETARQIKRMAKQIQSLQTILERNSNPQASPSSPTANGNKSPITQDEFLRDPMGSLQKMMDEREQRLKGEIPKTIEQREMEFQYQRSRQDALKLIKTNEAVKRDPEGMDRVTDILTDETYDLDRISQQYPLEAARIALEIYNARYGSKRSQSAPTKAQMTSVATSVQSGGGKSTIEQEAQDLHRQVLAMPELMQDPAFRAKLNAFTQKAKLEERMTAQ